MPTNKIVGESWMSDRIVGRGFPTAGPRSGRLSIGRDQSASAWPHRGYLDGVVISIERWPLRGPALLKVGAIDRRPLRGRRESLTGEGTGWALAGDHLDGDSPLKQAQTDLPAVFEAKHR